MRLENKIAVVTGAASGFGREIARRFADEGARVALLDINEAGVREAAGEIGSSAAAFVCDVTSRASIDAAIAGTVSAFGGLDIVVNNAGWSHRNKPMLDVEEDEFDRVFDVNVKSIFHMSRATVPVMREQARGGAIINIGSTAGIRPRPGLTWYNASKAAVNLVTKSMALELAPDRIRVVAIAPVIGNTGLLETFMGQPDTPENRERFIATIPLGRMSEPSDIAAAAVFLASDEASLISGNVMEVDGARCV